MAWGCVIVQVPPLRADLSMLRDIYIIYIYVYAILSNQVKLANQTHGPGPSNQRIVGECSTLKPLPKSASIVTNHRGCSMFAKADFLTSYFFFFFLSRCELITDIQPRGYLKEGPSLGSIQTLDRNCRDRWSLRNKKRRLQEEKKKEACKTPKNNPQRPREIYRCIEAHTH